MGLGRKDVSIHEPERWVANRIADVYDARPEYPRPLVDAVAALAGDTGARIADLGAGIGHLSLPLAARGFEVSAIEPAKAMLDRLQRTAASQALSVRAMHAAAENLPLHDASVDLVLISDALHFLDVERVADEISRVLAARGALAIVTCELAGTPFMRALVEIMQDAAPRRPKETASVATQLAALTRTPLHAPQIFDDEVVVDDATLERILRSISFIGPAMNPQRFEAFMQRVVALPGPKAWARRFTLLVGRRSK